MGLAERRHQEKRIKEKVSRYQSLAHLFIGNRTKFSAFNLTDKEDQVTLGKDSNRHGICRCGRNHGQCAGADVPAHLKRERQVLDRELEEIEIGYQEALGLDIPSWMAAPRPILLRL